MSILQIDVNLKRNSLFYKQLIAVPLTGNLKWNNGVASQHESIFRGNFAAINFVLDWKIPQTFIEFNKPFNIECDAVGFGWSWTKQLHSHRWQVATEFFCNIFTLHASLLIVWLCSHLLHMFVVHDMDIYTHIYFALLAQGAKTKHRNTHSNRISQMDWKACRHKCRRSVIWIQRLWRAVCKRFLQSNRSLDICHLFNNLLYLYCNRLLKMKQCYYVLECLCFSFYVHCDFALALALFW